MEDDDRAADATLGLALAGRTGNRLLSEEEEDAEGPGRPGMDGDVAARSTRAQTVDTLFRRVAAEEDGFLTERDPVDIVAAGLAVG